MTALSVINLKPVVNEFALNKATNFNILNGLDTFNRVFVKRVVNDIGVFSDVIGMTWPVY